MPRVGPVILWEKAVHNPDDGPKRTSHILLMTPTLTLRHQRIGDHASFHARLQLPFMTFTWTAHHHPQRDHG